MHCDSRVRWKVASDLRFRAAISAPKTPSCCGISGDLAPSTRKSLAIAIVRFWCAKGKQDEQTSGGPVSAHLLVVAPGNPSCAFPCSECCLRACALVLAIMYGYMLWSCHVCSLSLLVFAPKRGRSGRTLSGVTVLFLNLECYCATGGGYLGGGASAPRYQGPLECLSREAGRPMGPSTPRCSSQSCAFVCLVSC